MPGPEKGVRVSKEQVQALLQEMGLIHEAFESGFRCKLPGRWFLVQPYAPTFGQGIRWRLISNTMRENLSRPVLTMLRLRDEIQRYVNLTA